MDCLFDAMMLVIVFGLLVLVIWQFADICKVRKQAFDIEDALEEITDRLERMDGTFDDDMK